MRVWVERLLQTSTIDDFIVAEIDARVIRHVSAALGHQSSNTWLLFAKTADRLDGVVAVPLAKRIDPRLKTEVLSFVIAVMATTLGIVTPDT